MAPNPIIAVRIRERRERLGWTQAEPAQATGTTRATVGNYEAGRREPDAATLLRLARALGTSVSYLLGETDDP
ncbi:MAG TPA: helix-turn-helix transcriptional regulator, partial [Thermaerobacter sp.]